MSSPAPALRWIPLGQLLVDGRILTEEQLRRALELKGTTGQRLGELVVDLDTAELDKSAIALLPEELARRYEALPLRILEDGTPLLAVTDPTNLATAQELPAARRDQEEVLDPAASGVRVLIGVERDVENGTLRDQLETPDRPVGRDVASTLCGEPAPDPEQRRVRGDRARRQ